ncbi:MULTISPECIES: hypothetical protein [unclassified Mesorhizobium]|uniref:hypothetical protein n=3 Tax=Mesorhizobium TaxID=68287 RepID=UPI000F752AE9|nr:MULTISPECIES: hypothetical protein [unclassified Mesorhizobium]AZO04185.1 hypothetical protein EJ068_14805 [Mesorhizobium sp. M2A.F.Ca.ET.043.02.1.1]RUW41350.1 hypothetical protein EOA37_10410 [Mesorhizobium sp. M2A.F.Ca.ET.015.02.1.1]RVC99914.1 hypothetical protein EN753_25290 [Mesorhizobium sp. M2A.F.Ca.ET.029.05.1.1]RWB37963.1 MAG: hypothetical protein EOQ46_30705 [Mesorhizobium sp.]RWB55275.1 MAG: hypothetical protein EOQ48_30200 [Mesorhizobium sp.]
MSSRSFISKIIAAASIFAAIPLSSAYAVHRHHRAAVDTTTTASVPVDPEARVATQQLLGVKQGIREARQAGKITQDQARDLMRQADAIQPTRGRSAIGQINQLDQRLQNASGQGTYIGSGGDGGYYPNG